MEEEVIGLWVIFTSHNWRQPNNVHLTTDIIDDLLHGDEITWCALLRYLHETIPSQ